MERSLFPFAHIRWGRGCWRVQFLAGTGSVCSTGERTVDVFLVCLTARVAPGINVSLYRGSTCSDLEGSRWVYCRAFIPDSHDDCNEGHVAMIRVFYALWAAHFILLLVLPKMAAQASISNQLRIMVSRCPGPLQPLAAWAAVTPIALIDTAAHSTLWFPQVCFGCIGLLDTLSNRPQQRPRCSFSDKGLC